MSRICCFAGHSQIFGQQDIYEKLLSVIEDLIIFHSINEFWVGNYGDFDKLSARAIRHLKEKYSYIQLNLIIPYLTEEINSCKEEYYNNYDNMLIADIAENTPKKLQIIKCNEYMVNNSLFLVCYVNHSYGGAAKTLSYGKKSKELTIINLSE